jgi:hypothetical protein
VDATTKKIMQILAVGAVKKVLIAGGSILSGVGVATGFSAAEYAGAATAIVAAGYSFWNDYGKAIVLSQLEVMKAKSLAQAQALRLANQPQVTVKQIAEQSSKLTLDDTKAIVATLPHEIQSNISKPTEPAAKIVALLAILLLGAMAWPGDASAQIRIKTPAQLEQDFQALNAKVEALNTKVAGSAVAAVTGQSSQPSAALKNVMSALSKPFQDLADFIAGDADGAASLATLIPNLQDVNGKACWVKMQEASAVFKAHPVPVTLQVMTDFEALRLLQMTTNDLCSYTPCTVVFSDASNLVTGVASAVGGAIASSQVPSLTTLCSRIPQIAPQLPTAVTGLSASAAPVPAASPTPAASQSTPAPSQGNPALGAGPVNPTTAPAVTPPAATPAPAQP